MIKNEDIENSIAKNEKTEEITGIIESKKEKSKKNKEKTNELTGIIRPKKKTMIKFEDSIDEILYKINHYALLVNKLDYYGNSIPLGSFCFAISFIINGFFECEVYKNPDKFLSIILLLFGGIGQVIAGILEYIKGRTFPANFYLIYGIYFVSLYIMQYTSEKKIFEPKDCYKFYYGSWAGLTFPIFVASFHTNVFYLIQASIGCVFFVIKCIGESLDIPVMKGLVSGVLEIIIGVASFYICFNQIVNETLGFQLIPSIALKKDNEIDLDINKNEKKELSK